MTMNVAGALALVLCLTVTSNVPFTTETKNAAAFQKNDIELVTLYNENEETETVKTKETEEVAYENRWGIQLTEEEIDLLAKILWVEARGESEAGQKAVVEVIFNRMISEEFPDTLYDVLSQKNPTQFASWKLRDSAKPTEKEYASIYEVLTGKTSITKNDTVYFATKKLTRNLDVKIGGHYFCF